MATQKDYILGPHYGLKEAHNIRRRAAGKRALPYDLGWCIPMIVRIDLEEQDPQHRITIAHLADPNDVFSALCPERAEELQRVINEIKKIQVRPVSAKRLAELEAEQQHFERIAEQMGPEYLNFTK